MNSASTLAPLAPAKRTAVIAQPTYLPWLGYFEQMLRAEVFIFLDSVQFERCSWQCRNRIKGANGEPFWLTVPTTRHPLKTPISEVLVAPERADWASLRAIDFPLLRQLRGPEEFAPKPVNSSTPATTTTIRSGR